MSAARSGGAKVRGQRHRNVTAAAAAVAAPTTRTTVTGLYRPKWRQDVGRHPVFQTETVRQLWGRLDEGLVLRHMLRLQGRVRQDRSPVEQGQLAVAQRRQRTAKHVAMVKYAILMRSDQPGRDGIVFCIISVRSWQTHRLAPSVRSASCFDCRAGYGPVAPATTLPEPRNGL